MSNNHNVNRSALIETDLLYDTTARTVESIISNENYKVAETIIECGILPALSFFGLPANIINMLVFYRQGLRDKMNLCLFTLAFFDFMYILSMFISTIYCPAVFLSDTLLEQLLKWHTRKLTVNFMYTFWYSSGILTAIIATERCICVTVPMKAGTLCQTKTLACLISAAFLLLNLLCLPYALKHVVRWETDATGNVTVVMRDTALFEDNKLTFQIVRDNILPSISFTTYFVVSFVTAVSVRKLRTAMDWRQKAASQGMDKRQMTLVRMLITVSCVYITCNAPKLSLAVARFLVKEFSTIGNYRNLFYVTHRTGHGLLMVNASINIIIYCQQSSRFRKELRSMHFCCVKDQAKQSQTANMDTGTA